MVQKSPIDEMILALDENINYLKQVGNSQIKITNGNLIKNTEDVYIYEFELEFLQYIDEDADIELRVKGENSNGRVISVSENIIRVSIDKYLGDTIHEALLIISSYYLLQLLREKLNCVYNGDQKLTNLSEKTFNPLTSRNDIADYVIPPSSITQLPNIPQENAIKLALGSEVSYIWGPPGTGKTQTIARIIEGFLTKNLSVLLIAHTNIATDGALLYFVEHLKSSDEYLEGKFLREGVISKTELKKYDLVDPVKVLENKGKPIKIEIQRLINEIENNNEKIIKQEEIINKFQKLKNIINEVENVRVGISNKENVITSSTARLKEIFYKIKDIDENIQKYQSKGRLGKFFRG